MTQSDGECDAACSDTGVREVRASESNDGDLDVEEETPCLSSKDCPGSLVCDETRGLCFVCVKDADCASGSACAPDHECHARLACQSDKQCKDVGMICDPEASACVECIKSSHCPEEEYCLGSFCVPDICSGGQKECQGNSVAVCVEDGDVWVVAEACDRNQYCQGAMCIDLVCDPGSTSCAGSIFRVCNEKGTGFKQEEDCSLQGKNCTLDGCLPTKCVPGTIVCADGHTVVTCSADGMAQTADSCAEGTYCSAGQCLEWICTPIEPLCASGVATQCDELGSGPVSGGIECSGVGKICEDGECKTECVPQCDGKECGPDACGNECGQCQDGKECKNGKCLPPGMECYDGNDVDWDGCNGAKLAEFVVPSTTWDQQSDPSVATLPDGRWVVVWETYVPGCQSEIHGRLFLPDGGPSGLEFPVSKCPAHAYHSAIAWISGEDLIVIWTQELDATPAGGSEVYGQRITAAGEVLGEAFRINTTDLDDQEAADVDAPGDGSFVAIWHSKQQDGSDWGVFAQLFDETGAKVGSEVQINTVTAWAQRDADASFSPSGDMAVAWSSPFVDGDESAAVCRLFDGALQPVGQEFQVNEWVSYSQDVPAVSWVDATRFVVAWQSLNQDGPADYGVYARIFDESGQPASKELLVNTSTDKGQQWPEVAGIADDGFVIAWVSGLPGSIFQQRFFISGVKTGGEQKVNLGPGNAGGCAVASFADGSYVVVWTAGAGQDGNMTGVFAQRFNADGTRKYY